MRAELEQVEGLQSENIVDCLEGYLDLISTWYSLSASVMRAGLSAPPSRLRVGRLEGGGNIRLCVVELAMYHVRYMESRLHAHLPWNRMMESCGPIPRFYATSSAVMRWLYSRQEEHPGVLETLAQIYMRAKVVTVSGVCESRRRDPVYHAERAMRLSAEMIQSAYLCTH